jgi:hypothetical protein
MVAGRLDVPGNTSTANRIAVPNTMNLIQMDRKTMDSSAFIATANTKQLLIYWIFSV